LLLVLTVALLLVVNIALCSFVIRYCLPPMLLSGLWEGLLAYNQTVCSNSFASYSLESRLVKQQKILEYNTIGELLVSDISRLAATLLVIRNINECVIVNACSLNI